MKGLQKVKTFVSAFLLGGLTGAGLTLLMAPQSGEETRELIRDKSLELRDQAVENVEDTRKQAERRVEAVTKNTKDKASKLKRAGEKMVKEQRRSMEKGFENAKKAVGA